MKSAAFPVGIIFEYLMPSTYSIENSDWKSWNGGSLWYFFWVFFNFSDQNPWRIPKELWRLFSGAYTAGWNDYPDFKPKITPPKRFSSQCTKLKNDSYCKPLYKYVKFLKNTLIVFIFHFTLLNIYVLNSSWNVAHLY